MREVVGIVLTEDVNGSKNGEERDETGVRREGVGIGMCGDGDWVLGVVAVIVGRPSEAHVLEGEVEFVL